MTIVVISGDQPPPRGHHRHLGLRPGRAGRRGAQARRPRPGVRGPASAARRPRPGVRGPACTRYDGFVLQSVAPAPEIPASNDILEHKGATASRTFKPAKVHAGRVAPISPGSSMVSIRTFTPV